MTPTYDLLTRLVKIAPPLINTIASGPHCILATSVGQMVLDQIGIAADPYPVEVAVCNRAWMQWGRDGYHGGQEEQERRGAYILTNTPNWKGASFQTVKSAKPWDGHLVLRVSDGPHRWLVDLDLGSFNRPNRDIELPGGLVAPLTPDGIVQGTFTHGRIETSVQYGPLVAPYRDDYLKAKDWTRRARFFGEVETLVQALGKAATGPRSSGILPIHHG
jgi:hypothetical protein